MFADKRLAAGGADTSGENTDGCGLAGTVGAEEAEDLSRQDIKRDSVKRNDFRLGLFALCFRHAEREASRACGHGRSRVVDLAKVARANAGYHGWVPSRMTQDKRMRRRS